MKHFVFYLSCVILLFTSCNKNNQGNSNQNNSFIGKWRWILQTDAILVGGPPYDSLTPQNTGDVEFLNLNKDSTWSLIQNDKITQSGIFKFVDEPTQSGASI